MPVGAAIVVVAIYSPPGGHPPTNHFADLVLDKILAATTIWPFLLILCSA